MDWNELQNDIFNIIQSGSAELEAKEYTMVESEDMAKQIVDLIERRIDVPDSAVMRIADLQRQIAEIREKLRWIPVSERLPEKTCRVEVTTNKSIYWIRDFIFDDYDSVESFKRFVKKWRLIPELEDGE